MPGIVALAIAMTLLAAGSWPGGKAAAQERAPTIIGTLTCTSDAPLQGRTDARPSRRFKSDAGGDGNYTGTLARIGPPGMPGGKRVLVWSVLGPAASHRGALGGEYRGVTGMPAGVLVGDGNRFRLEPVTSTSQIGNQPVPTVLLLRLEATKV
jgi:Protein of unknown function (DUF992)